VAWYLVPDIWAAALLVKLGRRLSIAVYEGRSVMMMLMTLSEDDLEPRGPKIDGTHQRGTTALFRANIRQSEERFCTGFSASEMHCWTLQPVAVRKRPSETQHETNVAYLYSGGHRKTGK